MVHDHWEKQLATVVEKSLQTMTVELPNGEKRKEGFFSTAGAKRIAEISVGDSIFVVINRDAHDNHSKNPQIVKIDLPKSGEE